MGLANLPRFEFSILFGLVNLRIGKARVVSLYTDGLWRYEKCKHGWAYQKCIVHGCSHYCGQKATPVK